MSMNYAIFGAILAAVSSSPLASLETPPVAEANLLTAYFDLPNNKGGGALGAWGAVGPIALTDLNRHFSKRTARFGAELLGSHGEAGFVNTDRNTTFAFATSTFTIEWWHSTKSQDSGTIMGWWGATSTERAWYIEINNSSVSFVYRNTSSTTVRTISFSTGSVNIRQGNWHHVALCRNGSNLQCFLDGVSLGTLTISGNIFTPKATSSFFGVGNYFEPNPSGRYKGYLGEVRITNGIRRYTANFTPPAEAFPQSLAGDASWASVILLLDWYNADGYPAAINMDSDFFGGGQGEVNIWKATFSGSGSLLTTMYSSSGLTNANNLASIGINLRLENLVDTEGWTFEPSQSFDLDEEDFTFENWFSIPSTMTTGVTIIDLWPFKVISTGSTGSGEMYVQVRLETGFSQNFSTFTAPISTINHLAIVRKNGGAIRTYLNGVQVSSGSLDSPIESTESGDTVKMYKFYPRYVNVFYRAVRLRRGVCHYPDGISFTPPDPTVARPT